jgi:hypothetical protein
MNNLPMIETISVIKSGDTERKIQRIYYPSTGDITLVVTETTIKTYPNSDYDKVIADANNISEKI